MYGRSILPSAPEASRLAQRRADQAVAEAARLLPTVAQRIRWAARRGETRLDFEVPLARAPLEDVLRELERQLRLKGYRAERLADRPRALRILWGGSGGLFFSGGHTARC